MVRYPQTRWVAMQWVESGRAYQGPRVLIVENDATLVQALEWALALPLRALLGSEKDSLSSILNVLQAGLERAFFP